MTAVVLVHGVGLGPESLAPLERELGGATLVLERRGYGSRAALAPAAAVEDHVGDLVDLLDRAGLERAVIAGASGGATVALAAALIAPERVVAAVCHEPAVGSLAPELQAVVREALAEDGGLGLLRTLAGEATWDRLPASYRAELAVRADLVAADAAAFLAWEPPLGRPAASIVCSVGDRSPALRHEIAARVAARTGAAVAIVPGCGHLPQLDAPAPFAAVVRSAGALDRLSGRRPLELDRRAVARHGGPP